MEIRFDAGVANQFAGRIAVIDDLQRLKQLLRSAVQVSKLDDFQRLLDADEPTMWIGKAARFT